MMQSTEKQPLIVMTFNMRYDNVEDPFQWPDRLKAINQMIKIHEPDIIGSQELKQHQFVQLSTCLDNFTAYGVLRSEDDGAEMAAIFVNKARFEILDQGTFWLSTTPTVPYSLGWDAVLPRIASWVKLEDKIGSESPFLVVNTHLDHVGEQARFESVQLLTDFIEELDLPTLLLGDFNSTPDAPAMQKPLEKYDNTYTTLIGSESSSSLTFHDFKGGETGLPIDYIFARQPFFIKDVKILRDQPDGIYPSDHYPVMAWIEAFT